MEEPRSKSTTMTRSLNDFSDDILIHILSLFPTTQDAIKTTLISPKWRNLCRSIPSLSFIQTTFPRSTTLAETLRSFAEFVTQTLTRRNPNCPLIEFGLLLFCDVFYAHLVDVWIREAISLNVQHLDFQLVHGWSLSRDRNDVNDDVSWYIFEVMWYTFNFSVLSYTSVRVLKLGNVAIHLPGHLLDRNERFSSLRTLSLFRVYLTDQMFSEIIMGCVNLEDLDLNNCYGMGNVKIHSLKLRKLLLKSHLYAGSVEIFAPNLKLLHMNSFEVKKYVFGDISSLVQARINCYHYSFWSIIVRSLGHVQRLTVQNCWFKLLVSENALLESFVLYNLKYLELGTGYSKSELLGMAALLERCPNLVTMILNCITESFEEESLSEEFLNKPITLSIPSLKRVEFVCYKETDNELLLVELLKEQGVEVILLYNAEACDAKSSPKRKREYGEIDYFRDVM